MSAEFPTLAEVVAKHRWVSKSSTTRYVAGCACGWELDIANTHRTGLQLHGEHVEQVWREACTIRTVEQLDALPDRSVVFAANEAAWIKVSGWSPDEPWWVTGSSIESPSADIALPALLIRHPDWAKS